MDISPLKYTKTMIPQADLDKIQQIKQDIISGKIKVWNVIDQGYPDLFQK